MPQLDLEQFDWEKLCYYRAMLASALPAPERVAADGLQVCDAPAERPGMIDVVHERDRGISLWGTALCMVLKQPLAPLPLARPVAYAEVLIHGGSSVGLVGNVAYHKSAHIGWYETSLGYHGDEGSIYFNSGSSSHKFGPPFGLDPEFVVANDETRAPRRADVIGVGIDCGTSTGEATGATEKTIFFTKNGSMVGSMALPSEHLKHLALTLHRSGDSASVNVGTSRFFFDVEAYSQVPRPPVTLVLQQPRVRMWGPPEGDETDDDFREGDETHDDF